MPGPAQEEPEDLSSQIEDVDLALDDESPGEVEALDLAVGDDPPTDIEAVDLPLEFEAMWETVSEKCSSLEQIESIPIFSDFITRVEAARSERELRTETESWLLGALFCRAEASFNLREMEVVDSDLQRILEPDPGFQIDTSRSSPRLAARLEEMRAETVGELIIDLPVEPETVALDDRVISPVSGEKMPVLAGTYMLEVSRPGFSSIRQEIEVLPGETLTVEAAIERTSAVLQVTVEPCVALLELDGAPVSTKAPSIDFPGAVEDSCELVVDGLQPGEHVLTVSNEGYRTWEGQLTIETLTDYFLEPIVLEPTRGWLVVRGLPPRIQYTIDGKLQESPKPDDGPARFELPTGAHEVRIDLGTTGLFEQQVQIEDQEEEIVDVDLKPTLSYLGAIGGDSQSRLQVDQSIETAMLALDRPLYRRAGCDTEELLGEHSISAETLRDLAGIQPIFDRPWNERRLQEDLDTRCRGSLYLLAVLPDDPLPAGADLWIWSSAPGPLSPGIRRISLPAGQDLEALRDAISAELRLERVWIGADLIDSLLSSGPLILSVTPGGPAEAAGLTPGDEIVSVNGTAIASAGALREMIDKASPGSKSRFQIRRGTSTVEVDLETTFAPVAAPLLQPNAIPAAASSQISMMRETTSEIEPWVLDLNHALVLMGAGEWGLAARELDRIRAPETAGLSSGTVSYLLARALLKSENEAHRERARAALATAAEDDDARLFAADGPRVSPRASIRLRELTVLGRKE
jgi:hypothetical protein